MITLLKRTILYINLYNIKKIVVMKILLLVLGVSLFTFAKAQQQNPAPLLLSYTDDMVVDYYRTLFKTKKSSFNIIRRRISQGNLIIEVMPSGEFENFYKFSIMHFVFKRVNNSELWCVKQVVIMPEKYSTETLAPFESNLEGDFQEISKGHWQKKATLNDVFLLDVTAKVEEADGGNVFSLTYEYIKN